MRTLILALFLLNVPVSAQQLNLPSTRLLHMGETPNRPESLSAHLMSAEATTFSRLLTKGSPVYNADGTLADVQDEIGKGGKLFATADQRIMLLVDQRFTPVRVSFWYRKLKHGKPSTVMQRVKDDSGDWVIASFIEEEAKTLFDVLAIEEKRVTIAVTEEATKTVIQKVFSTKDNHAFLSCWASEEGEALLSFAQGQDKLEGFFNMRNICHVGFRVDALEAVNLIPPKAAPAGNAQKTDKELLYEAKLYAAKQMLDYAPNLNRGYGPRSNGSANFYKQQAWYLSWVGREEALVEWAEAQPRGYGSGVDQRFSNWAHIFDNHVQREFKRLKEEQQLNQNFIPVP